MEKKKKKKSNLWPWVARGPSLWGLREKFQIYDATAPVTNGCSDAICAGVTSTNDHHFLVLGRYVFTILEITIKQAFSVCMKELHGKMNSI